VKNLTETRPALARGFRWNVGRAVDDLWKKIERPSGRESPTLLTPVFHTDRHRHETGRSGI
jgi:hypothetical protein